MAAIRGLRSDSRANGDVHSPTAKNRSPRRSSATAEATFSEGKMANRIVGRVVIGAVGALGLLALPATLSAQTAAAPTFTKDVAPIFQNKCESCHRPDSIAPMSLQSYEEARPWAR